MADEAIEAVAEEGGPRPWRALWMSAAALLVTLALIALIFMITWSNRARDEALGWERHTYGVMLLTRSIDASIARAEAALGHYVLDEEQLTGTAYYNEWRNAAFQIDQLQRLVREDRAQLNRVEGLRLLFDRRGRELAPAASAAERGRGSGGLNFLFQVAGSPTHNALRGKLEEIARAERTTLARRTEATEGVVARADAFTEWLGWLAILLGVGAVGLAILAYRSFLEGIRARREAESESLRALELEKAVQERTRDLSTANERLKAEATERAAAEAQLRQVQKMEAVGQLTGGIAHDFNNMLAVVVGGLDLARRKLHGSRREVEFHLENAMEGATRAAALTRRLLAFARAEPLLPEAVLPADRVKTMLDLIDRAIGERITVHTRLPPDRWFVWADPTQLENALLNMAVNGRDAMDGNGELMIEVDNVSLGAGVVDDLPAGEYVRISVADTGAGIAPEHIDRVFEPFFTTKPVGKGTGLGLTQIFGFARQSGGHATIASKLGEGTIVSLYLPRFVGAEERLPTPATLPGMAEPARRHPGATILVVEDDPRVSRSTVDALEELGYRPLACASGREALELLGQHPEVDLVLTDVMMPEMTGTELAAELRRRDAQVPVLFVTGYVGETGDIDDLIAGELLRKPFTVAALANAVENALGGGRFNGSRLASTDAAAE
jgi:signal transduction histidine kinase/CheY-like chemotaxis protein